ncbi:DUF1648 domain-containing protein [Calidifontibacillus erzurumensis]|uniref:DUF1648 domain-containing protein n=1 Tax=Calidifontibacillus erzurumensis TaxID=2741433 RepID=A0A8J8KCN3_9BACI|nr:DUF1648 domain-containing protein [Calidifontibacillus erzurumensis]NSL53259.1 DUF1648 domain-containing protein [Calidifontibacillus erzurumensis]
MPIHKERLKLKIPKTKSEWLWDFIGYSFYFGSIVLLIAVWNILPEKVPAHYNAFGEIDRWGSKWELLILPGIGALILLFMQIMEKHPEVHQYPERLNEANAEQFYLISRKLVNQLKNICLILFGVLLFEMVSDALGWGIRFGKWLLPLIIIGTIAPIIIGMIKQSKIK